MAHDWLVREIESLREYAALNGLTALSEQLDQARLLALTEIASKCRSVAVQSQQAGSRSDA